MKLSLSRIRAVNFKGLTFDERLAPATVFLGGNFAGKTARGDAIRLALLGYIPDLAQTARAAFEMSSGREMIVEADLTDETGRVFNLWRRFYLKGDAVKTEARIPPAISDCGVLAVMLNAEEYFGLGDAERIRYVFEHVGGISGFTPQEIIERVDRSLSESHPPAPVADFCELMTAEGADWKPSEKEPGMECAREFIEVAARVADGIKKISAATADGMEKTIQRLSQLRAADPEGQTLASMETRNGELTREVADLTEKKQMLLGRYDEVRRARGRRRDLQAELAKAEPARVTLADLKKSQEDLEADLNRLGAEIEQFPDLFALGEKLLAQKTQLTVIEIELENHRKRELEVAAGLNRLTTDSRCPYCGAAGEGWKTLKRAEYAAEIEQIDLRRQTLATDQTRVSGEINQTAAMQTGVRERSQRRSGLAQRRDGVLRQMGSLEQSLARLDALREEMKHLTADDPELEARVETIQTAINVKNADIRAFDGQYRLALGRQGELKRLAEAEQARDNALAVNRVAVSAVKLLREIQEEMIEAAFRPLLAGANLFEKVMRTPLAYRNGEIGTDRGGVWFSHRVFSGVEKALTYAAIQAALAEKAPVRLMILDELGRFDGAVMLQVFDAITKRIAEGRLDGFIGMAPALWIDCKGINFVKLPAVATYHRPQFQ